MHMHAAMYAYIIPHYFHSHIHMRKICNACVKNRRRNRVSMACINMLVRYADLHLFFFFFFFLFFQKGEKKKKAKTKVDQRQN